MASGDFLDLQTNLAILAGRSTAADLDEDLALCKQCINEALLEVYRPVDGRYPEWARRTVTLRYRASATISVGVTEGSRVITGYAFPSDTIGSLVQIGSKFYRYAGSTSGGSTVVVSGAGTASVNGTYWPTGTLNGRVIYYLNGEVDAGNPALWFSGTEWFIGLLGSEIYMTTGDDAPWEETWTPTIVGPGDSPAPTVTQGPDYYLVEPFNETTGSYTATLHHVSQPLPADVAEVVGGVEWMGHGFLSPMTDRETDVGYRSATMGDYRPDYGAGFYGLYSRGLRGTAFPQGDLLFYYVETDALTEGATVLRRMNIVPIPREAAVVSFRANVVPVELSADADRPKIVADLVTRCLLPIAREIWGITYKKYTGDNQDALIRQADKAREILTGMAKPQKRFSGVARPGY